MDFRLSALPIIEVEITAIDLNDHTYRISSTEDSRAVARSIRCLGMLQPPIVKSADKEKRYWRIVAGFKRVRACQGLGWQSIAVKVLPAEITDKQCAQLAIADNALARPLSVMERVRAVALLQPLAADMEALAESLPPLGMPENPAMIDKLLRLGRQPAEIQRAVENDRLSLAMALELANESKTAAKAMCDIFVCLRLGLNRQRELLSMLRDISRRDDIAIAELIGANSVQEMLNDGDSERPRITKRIIDHFKRVRYPEISTSETRRRALIADLDLPAGVDLRPPPSHETSTFTLMIQFSDTEQLKQRFHKLHAVVHHPGIIKLTDA